MSFAAINQTTGKGCGRVRIAISGFGFGGLIL